MAEIRKRFLKALQKERPADCQSAKQQAASLRYNWAARQRSPDMML